MGLFRSIFKKVAGVQEFFMSTHTYYTYNEYYKKHKVRHDEEGKPKIDNVETYIHLSEPENAIRIFYGQKLLNLINQKKNIHPNANQIFIECFNDPSELFFISQKEKSKTEKYYIVKDINGEPRKVVVNGKKILFYSKWDAFHGEYLRLKIFE